MNRRVIVASMGLTLALFSASCRETSQPETGSRPSDHHAAASAHRIIALAPNATEIICALDACDRLVGVSRFCTYPPEVASVQKIGGLRDPDLELIATIKPDLLILRGRGESSAPLRRLADAMNIRIYDDPVETLDDLHETIGHLGTLLDRSSQAAAMQNVIRTELAKLADSVMDRPRPRVLFTLRSPAALTNILSVGPGSFVHEIIEIAGGSNILADQRAAYPSVSLEEIIGRDPEVIIESMAGMSIDNSQREDLLRQWSSLSSVSAVQTRRIHFVTEEYLTIPSQRVTLSARKLRSLIHPEAADD